MTTPTRTPVQSNVCDFEEIVGGDVFITPKSNLSSIINPHSPKPLYKTTVIQGSPRRSTSTKKSSKSQLSTKCDKCGQCRSCERIKQQFSSPSAATLHSPPLAENTEDGTLKSFQPQFLSTVQSQVKMSESEQSKWQTVRTITETIIREKDMIIERQKLKRLQLEQQVRELETKLSKMALAQAVSVESSLRNTHQSQLEIEEQTYNQLISSAKALSDNSSLAKVVMEKSQLERQLGEAENKIAELRCSLLTTKSDLQQQIDYYKKMLQLSKDQEEALQSKNESMQAEESHACKELSRLKLYLGELPTKEEHCELSERLEEASQSLSQRDQHITALVDEKSALQTECDELKEELSEGKEQVGQLLNQVTLLQKEVKGWEEKEQARQSVTEDDIVQIKESYRQLYDDHQTNVKCLEAHEKTAKATVTGYEEKIARLSERLEHSETLIDAAQQECEARSRQITEADSEICQLKQENQDLRDKMASWQGKIAAAEEVVSAESHLLERSLVEDIVFCTSSLECLVEMCDNPRGLDLADILATRPTPVTISSPREYLSVMNQQGASLKSVNDKIEKLRQFILDKYADDMASSGHIECATQ